MERYLMYLRKSRMDTDYENVSVAETLSRHRKILEDFCKLKRLHAYLRGNEALSMGEQFKKKHISAGLLAHV